MTNIISRRNFIGGVSLATLVGAVSPILSACGKKRGYKLGVADWSIGLSANPDSFKLAKSIGLNGVQVSSGKRFLTGEFLTAQELDEYKNAMIATSLECASTAPTGMNGKPFITENGTVEYACGALDSAAALGAKTILLPFYGKASMLDKSTKRMIPELFEKLVPRLKTLAAHAEKAGVSVSLENSLNAEDDLRIIDAVGSPAVRIYADIMNFQYYGFDSVSEIRKLKGHIGQIHLKDIGHKLDSKSGMPRDVDACLDVIGEIGYDGWLVFELHGNPKAPDTNANIIAYNAAYVKNSKLFK